ncbi:MAG: crossover junction endodeoxyribonuclease RuvC [Clostridia bacterium]|nr:crossover junction endodeoxyribonuclease RuvC [Clostridia bacterium]
MRILGIDPGIATTGWGVVDYERSRTVAVGYGSIITTPDTPIPQRLLSVEENIAQLIEKYHPDAMAVEELFFNTNATTAIVVAEARGVILTSAAKRGLKIFEYTPSQVKQAVVGYGKAEKKQVIAMVTMLLGLEKPPKPDDTADALAIAICHAHTGESVMAGYFNAPTSMVRRKKGRDA